MWLVHFILSPSPLEKGHSFMALGLYSHASGPLLCPSAKKSLSKKGCSRRHPHLLIERRQWKNICKSIPRNQEKNRRRETVKQQSWVQGDGCLLKRISDEAEEKTESSSSLMPRCYVSLFLLKAWLVRSTYSRIIFLQCRSAGAPAVIRLSFLSWISSYRINFKGAVKTYLF